MLKKTSYRMAISDEKHVVRKHDFIYLPLGIDDAISNTGVVGLVLAAVGPQTDKVWSQMESDGGLIRKLPKAYQFAIE